MMWWMLRILVKFTHQVAVRCEFSLIVHSPPCQLRFDFCPSTALPACLKLSWRSENGYCWYAGLLRAIFSVNQLTTKNIFRSSIHNIFIRYCNRGSFVYLGAQKSFNTLNFSYVSSYLITVFLFYLLVSLPKYSC